MKNELFAGVRGFRASCVSVLGSEFAPDDEGDAYVVAVDDLDRLIERLEELKEVNAKHVLNRIEEEGKRYECEDGHKITDEQISEAWKEIENQRRTHITTPVYPVLRKLGIFRCEGCGGSCGVGPPRQSVRGDGSFVRNKCPDCNGNGWVRRAGMSD